MLPKQTNQKLFWAPPSLFEPCFISFYKRDQTFSQFALEIQASNPETRKLKKTGVDLEDAIFNGVLSLFPDVSELYCVHHMKQWDKIKIGKLLAKFKCSEMKRYWQEKN